jgi:hypothetical protein
MNDLKIERDKNDTQDPQKYVSGFPASESDKNALNEVA